MTQFCHPKPLAIVTTTCLFLTCADIAVPADNRGSLSVQAAPGLVEVQPRPVGQRSLSLPDLTFDLAIHIACGPETQPASVSIGVADVSRTLQHDSITNRNEIQATLQVPAREVAPVELDGFCVADTPSSPANDDTLLKSVLTAQVSLRCTGKSGATMRFTSTALDVHLKCNTTAVTTTHQSDDVVAESPLATKY